MNDGAAPADADAMIGTSAQWRRVRKQIDQVAPTASTVLIQGETGTGKELVARAIHDRSERADRALIALNCAAMPRDLVESELFGHERGAFTGASQQRHGHFELAHGGSLFLDEIGELPCETQCKLLRVLQQREFRRIGGTRDIRTDVRVIAATNRDLREEVSAGRFRADLYFRLNVFPILLPPLRERRDDIPLLIQHLADRAAQRLGRPCPDVTPLFIARAIAYDWPGNVRELENLIERTLIMSAGAMLDAFEELPVRVASGGSATNLTDARLEARPPFEGTMDAVTTSHLRRVLDGTRWQIEGDRGAARILGLNPSTLRGRMRKLGLRKPA